MNEVKRWGITTHYGKTIFRSRLEARWAAFFDLRGWAWTYEPFDGSGYIPDFLIKGERPFIVEIKPATTLEEYEAAMESISIPWELFPRERVALGVDPLPGIARKYVQDGMFQFEHTGGLIQSDWCRPDWWPVVWYWCVMCDEIRFHVPEGDFRFMPCGHGDGDLLLHGDHRSLPGTIEGDWRIAGNKVQWTPG